MTDTCADCIPNNVERDVLLCPKHRVTDKLIAALEDMTACHHRDLAECTFAMFHGAARRALAKVQEEART